MEFTSETSSPSDGNLDLQQFQEKILAKCNKYRAAAKKDFTKRSDVLSALETGFGKDAVAAAIVVHKREAAEAPEAPGQQPTDNLEDAATDATQELQVQMQ
mmetsp:Transcript_3256/g.6943  ORF Transcript_3256/g.6943 Transcript_3256/m.6943 type:complete len:101 (+) Transcript_3256:98-400(+)